MKSKAWRVDFPCCVRENCESGSRVTDSRSLTDAPEYAGGRLS